MTWPPDQHSDDPFDDLAHVVAAFAQVGVANLFELGDQKLHLLHDCPFGVATTFTDDLLRHFGQFRVGKNHHMQVDEGANVGWRFPHLALHCRELASHLLQYGFKTRDFFFDHAWRDDQVRHLKRGLRDPGAPDRLRCRSMRRDRAK